MDYPPPPPLDAPKKSTAKWWIIGCSGCFLITAIVGGILAYGAYKAASAAAGGIEMLATYGQVMTAPEVTEALGDKVEMSGLPTSTETETTKVNTLNLSGPKGTGVAVVNQEKQPDGKWKITTIKFTPSGGAEMELKIQAIFP